MLTQITSTRKLRKFLTYDLEWIPGTLQVRCVGVFDGERYRWYDSVDKFLAAEMTDHNRNKWFFAHAGGMADVQFIFQEILKNRGYDIEASFSSSSAIIVKVKKKNGKNTWRFIDSYWLFRDSLARIGHSIGMEKTGPKALYNASSEQIKNWYATVSLSELIPYNENDCRILWHAIDRFETSLLEMGGQLQMTIASCAMQLFRRRYLSKDIATHMCVNDLSRKAYFASRVEVFQTSCESAFYYDINSSFPYAMTQPVPGEFIKSTRKLPDDFTKMFLADVEYSIGDCYFPPIPSRVDGRLFFPIGSKRSWLTGIDIELLQKEGYKIDHVYEVMLFETNNDLKGYAMDIYNQRKAVSDPFDKLRLKYLLNSLYGKFGESRTKDRLHIFPTVQTLKRLERQYSLEQRDAMMLLPGVFIEPCEVEIAHEHVPVAAYITARARATLYNYLSQSRDIYYCDTDGFATSDPYEVSNELGGLKLEKMITLPSQFVAPKVYRLNIDRDHTIVKAKGFSLGKSNDDGTSSNEMVQRFDKLVAGDEIQIDRMARIRENLKRAGRMKRNFEPLETTIKKGLRGNMCSKRFQYPDGQTRPWHLKELEK